MTPPAPLVLSESDGSATTVLTLNRPDKRNALNVALIEALCAAIVAVDRVPAQRVLILRGAGPAFCAGLDLVEAADPEHTHRSAQGLARVLTLLAESRLVTIAAVHGAAIAGGAGLMSACDFAVAESGTMIGYPEPRRGLVAGLVMTFLRRQLRERDAREVLLGSELFPAERAREIGLVNRVAPPAGAMAEARIFAASVLEGGPRAVESTKRQLAGLWPRTAAKDIEDSLELHLKARHSSEAKEGIAAYLGKRPPRWPS